MGYIVSRVNNLEEDKVDKPSVADDGKIPRAKDGSVEWVEIGQPTDAQTESVITRWLDNHPEATTTVQDKSLTIDKMVVGTLGYVTPEMFGAKGDGVTDDTQAIISAINLGIEKSVTVVACNNYLTSNPIVISGGIRFNFYLLGKITYNGTKQAILITNCSRCNFSFANINAMEGSCIKLFSDSNRNNRVSYCNISFGVLNSLNNCIEIEIGTNDGYCNENIIRGGWLGSGRYGIYADAKGRSEIQFKAYNIGFEGVECGLYLNGTSSCALILPRYAEQDKILYARNARYLLIVAVDKFYAHKIDIDATLTGQVFAPICEKLGGVLGFRGIFCNGYVNPIDKLTEYVNTNNATLDLSAEENYIVKLPRYFFVGEGCSYIKLNKLYGNVGAVPIGINEFVCKFAFDNGKDFKIYDGNGNVIFNNTSSCGWKECKFTYYDNIGWKCEILNSINNLVV